jgi:hypothetical protein
MYVAVTKNECWNLWWTETKTIQQYQSRRSRFVDVEEDQKKKKKRPEYDWQQ